MVGVGYLVVLVVVVDYLVVVAVRVVAVVVNGDYCLSTLTSCTSF